MTTDPFGLYARYYDLLYETKDYVDEASFVDRIIRAHAPNTRTILDLGCGTGRHDVLLAQKGYAITGVDRSEEMLATARRRTPSVEFRNGDIRNVRLGLKYDVVISLFHVINYQTTNADLRGTFDTVRSHLAPGGLFIFDFWYGPAVLSDRPVNKKKHIANNELEVTRLTRPIIHVNQNICDVNFDVTIRDKQSDHTETLTELHRMRYLFMPEIIELIDGIGAAPIVIAEWLTDREPGDSTWYVYCACRMA